MNSKAYCREALAAVSRSFIRPIEVLRPPLDDAVTVGYLLCRIADTVEDATHLPVRARLALFALLEDVLEGRQRPGAFTRAWAEASADESNGAEDDLARHLDTVLDLAATLPPPWLEAMVDRVVEMTRGMAIYARRKPASDGLRVLLTPGDLARYCWFVAGIVGQMLTDLFALDGAVDDRPAVRGLAEQFGLGLQLVNILKDVTDDYARGVVYVPASCLDEAGLRPATLLDPTHRPAAHEAVRPVFAMARRALEAAVGYCLAVAPARRDVRMFCIVPLWMAARTLDVARGARAQFDPRATVKIARSEVYAIIARAQAIAGDDAALVRDWRRTAPWWLEPEAWEETS